MKILFGIMSAIATDRTVAQLCRQLAPYTVVIHHDYSQQRDFRVDEKHVRFVPDPLRTGYGCWAFPAGILHLIRYCIDELDFDYFQLLSPSCLPIRPLTEFAEHLAESPFDGNLDYLDLAEQDVMMHFGPRSFAPPHSVRRWALRYAKSMYFGSDFATSERGMLQLFSRRQNGTLPLLARIGLKIMQIGQHAPFAVRPPGGNSHLYIGGPWIGAKRHVCEYIVDRASDPEWLRYLQGVNDICELTFATILGNSPYAIGPANHYISEYDGWHPRWLEAKDIGTLSTIDRHFARKFPDDPNAEVRKLVLEQLVRRQRGFESREILDVSAAASQRAPDCSNEEANRQLSS